MPVISWCVIFDWFLALACRRHTILKYNIRARPHALSSSHLRSRNRVRKLCQVFFWSYLVPVLLSPSLYPEPLHEFQMQP